MEYLTTFNFFGIVNAFNNGKLNIGREAPDLQISVPM